MILKLTEKGEITLLDEEKPINQNDHLVNVLRVFADFLTEKQSLFVCYQYIKMPNGQSVANDLIYTIPLRTINTDKNGYFEQIPEEVIKTPGEWKLQLFVRTYPHGFENKYTEQLASKPFYFSVQTGIPQIDNPTDYSYADLVTMQSAIEEIYTYLGLENIQGNIIPLKQGEAVGSLQQSIVEEGETKGSRAHGKYSVALNKDNNAYQRSSFVVGGGNQVGLKEEEFNNIYPDGVDSTGSPYDKSTSFGFASGQQNRAYSRGAGILGGYLNVVDGNFSGIVGGYGNTVSALYAGVLGGAGNYIDVSAERSAILGGYQNIVKGVDSSVGGTNNDIRSANTHAFGEGLKTDKLHGSNKFVVGKYNDPNSIASFQIGNGSGNSDRKNLVESFDNGILKYNVTADGTEPYQIANMGAVKNVVTEALKDINISGGGNSGESSGGSLYQHSIELVYNERDGHNDDVFRCINLWFSFVSSKSTEYDLEALIHKGFTGVGQGEMNFTAQYTDDGNNAIYGVGPVSITIDTDGMLFVQGALSSDTTGNEYMPPSVSTNAELIESQDVSITVSDTVEELGGGGSGDLSGYVAKSTEYPEAPIVYGRGANYENFSDKVYVVTHIPSWGNLVMWGDPDNVGADNGIDYSWGTLCCPVPKQPYQVANMKYVDDGLDKKLNSRASTVPEGAKFAYGIIRNTDTYFTVYSNDGNYETAEANISIAQYENGCLSGRTPKNPYHYATKKYVDEQISNSGGGSGGTVTIPDYYITDEELEAELSSYATTAYVDEQISKVVSGGEIDLEGYVKKEELNAHIEDFDALENEAINKLNNHSTRLVEVEGTLSLHGARLNRLEEDVSEINETLAEHTEQIDTVTKGAMANGNDIKNLDAAIDNIFNRVRALEELASVGTAGTKLYLHEIDFGYNTNYGNDTFRLSFVTNIGSELSMDDLANYAEAKDLINVKIDGEEFTAKQTVVDLQISDEGYESYVMHVWVMSKDSNDIEQFELRELIANGYYISEWIDGGHSDGTSLTEKIIELKEIINSRKLYQHYVSFNIMGKYSSDSAAVNTIVGKVIFSMVSTDGSKITEDNLIDKLKDANKISTDFPYLPVNGYYKGGYNNKQLSVWALRIDSDMQHIKLCINDGTEATLDGIGMGSAGIVHNLTDIIRLLPWESSV